MTSSDGMQVGLSAAAPSFVAGQAGPRAGSGRGRAGGRAGARRPRCRRAWPQSPARGSRRRCTGGTSRARPGASRRALCSCARSARRSRRHPARRRPARPGTGTGAPRAARAASARCAAAAAPPAPAPRAPRWPQSGLSPYPMPMSAASSCVRKSSPRGARSARSTGAAYARAPLAAWQMRTGALARWGATALGVQTVITPLERRGRQRRSRMNGMRACTERMPSGGATSSSCSGWFRMSMRTTLGLRAPPDRQALPRQHSQTRPRHRTARRHTHPALAV